MRARLTHCLILVLAGGAAASAASGNGTFTGTTDQGRKAKLVADSQGRVQRGAFTLQTDCSGAFDPFRARVELEAPLDRTTQDGFRDVGATLDEDGEFSGRYRHEIDGEYAGTHRIEGTLSLTVTFRRDGKKYVTCEAADIGFAVEDRKLTRRTAESHGEGDARTPQAAPSRSCTRRARC